MKMFWNYCIFYLKQWPKWMSSFLGNETDRVEALHDSLKKSLSFLSNFLCNFLQKPIEKKKFYSSLIAGFFRH